VWYSGASSRVTTGLDGTSSGWSPHWSAVDSGSPYELAGLTVLHVDKDFELIAAVNGQPMQRSDD
jgi:hypothetical protein